MAEHRANRLLRNALAGSGCTAAAAVCLAALPGCEAIENIPAGSSSILAAFQPPSPQQAAEWMTDPYDANNRYRGTLLIANSSFGGEPIYVDAYRRLASDEDAGVRAAAARALALHGQPRDVASLIPLLKDPDRLVRLEAARGLQRLHDPAAVEPLLLRLRVPPPAGAIPAGASLLDYGEEDPLVRAEAADALGQYRQTRVIEALIASLDDPSLAVNDATLRSLATLTGQNFGLDRAAWGAWVSNRLPEGEAALFAAGDVYTYPTFERGPRLYEYLPLIPDPPNETPAPPVGLPRPGLQE